MNPVTRQIGRRTWTTTSCGSAPQILLRANRRTTVRSPRRRAATPSVRCARGAVAAARWITPAQAVLAWHAARGVVAIPKAASPEHQALNLAAAQVRLSPDEVAAITALGAPDGRLWGADPATHEEF